MSEAIILYRSRGGVDPESLKPQVITTSGEYVAPVTGTYWIGAVGGGGGGGGSCVNAASGSGTYYGAGGTRGTLNTKSIALNAGDRITMSLGAGGAAGTNNTSKTTYSNGCNNSMGTSGSTGSTTTFGSYISGSGGSKGNRAQSWQTWINSISQWNNVIVNWSNKQKWSNKRGNLINIYWWQCTCGAYWTTTVDKVPSHMHTGYEATFSLHRTTQEWEWNNTFLGWNNVPEWSNTPIWYNYKQHYTDYAYTSIQQGTWWYQASNNQVSTSGTRTYRGRWWCIR